MRRQDQRRAFKKKQQQEEAQKPRVKPNFKAMITVQITRTLWIQVPVGTDPAEAKARYLNKVYDHLAAPRALFVNLKGRVR